MRNWRSSITAILDVKIPAINFELTLFHRTISALAHTEYIDYDHEKLASYIGESEIKNEKRKKLIMYRLYQRI